MPIQPSYLQHFYSGLEPLQAFDVVYGGCFEHRLVSSLLATMEHQRLVLGDVRLETGRYEFPVIAHGTMPKDGLCIGFMAEGGEMTRCNTAAIHAEEIQIYPPGIELLYHASGNSRWVNFTVSEERLQQAAVARMGRPLRLRRHSFHSIRLRSGGRQRLTTLTDDVLGLARRLQASGGMAPALAQEVCDCLLAGYVDAIAPATLPGKAERLAVEQRHYQLIAACERLVLSGEAADVALTEVARRSGYTLRSLEMIFRRSVGMPPGRWFMTARLNGALRDLLTCDSVFTVSEIAMKWGFRHMSRFAEYYRRTFGELPSETLARSAMRH